ncbi:MAG TPA: preprotein translocase subunit SecE [Candidatus Corynebacterium avicola]|uniref:Protein translocase subunit SecE n=1 Tax=Candidatus Corynebacterium avicola TaxID=2838527 RepID=A0A9D1RNJ0_9CORY|nr:preprotein translocase subunit SecE [Candidatus Corynebacterium avicola]
MSDDKNNADRTDNVGGSPLRPSGKRQVSNSEASPAGAASSRSDITVSKEDGTSGKSGGARALAFPRSVGSEMKKVIWPTGREMFTYSIVTLVFLIFITALCTGVDLLAGEGIEFMFGL